MAGNQEKISSFKDLKVWQETRKLVLLVYKITKSFPKEELYALISQMRRAAVSILANIAEGFSRQTIPEKLQFYSIAHGSLTELESYALIAKDLNYLDGEQFALLEEQLNIVHKLINAFSRSVRQNKVQTAKYQIPNTKYQSGQTLIETMLATFILTASLVAGLSLAIYALTSSAVSESQVIATNLAREGIEVVRLMRDSNWLAAEPDPAQPDPDSSDDLQSCPDLGGNFCYPKAFTAPTYNLSAGSYRISYNSITRAWALEPVVSYDLFVQADGKYSHVTNGPSVYARKIEIAYNTASPYTPQNPEVHVRSLVLWRGKNCTEFNGASDIALVSTPCKVVIEEHLTNWKDYK